MIINKLNNIETANMLAKNGQGIGITPNEIDWLIKTNKIFSEALLLIAGGAVHKTGQKPNRIAKKALEET